MIAIEKQQPPLSVKVARLSTTLAQAITINIVIIFTTALIQRWLLPWIPIDIILIPLIPFCLLTVAAILTLITAILVAAATGHLTETWEELIK